MAVTLTERELPNKCTTRSQWLHNEGCTNFFHSQLWLPHKVSYTTNGPYLGGMSSLTTWWHYEFK